jgi:ATP synthase protein I
MTECRRQKWRATVSRYLKGREFALQAVLAQLCFTLTLSAAGLAVNNQIALSLLCGGIISVAANSWLVLMAFRPPLGAPAQKILASFYVGGLGKFIITALLFLLAFKQFVFLKNASYAAVMILAYVIVQAVAWIYPLVRR